MKILFVFPNFESRLGDFHVGIASLSAVLKEDGHNIRLIQLKRVDKPEWKDKITKEIKNFKPDLVAFSLTELYSTFFEECSVFIKKNFDLPIIAGGSYPTMSPEETLPFADALIRGECEDVIKEIIGNIEKGKSIKHIASVWTKEDGKVYRNSNAPVPNVNDLPIADRSIFDVESICRGSMDVMCSRGCPFGCTYCINRHVMKLYPNKAQYVRFREIDSIIEEIQALREQYNFHTVTLPDDTVLLDLKWIEEFSRAYKKEIDMPFHANARPETCKEDIVKAFANAGCEILRIGVESGNENIRRKVLGRPTSEDQIIQAFDNSKKYGIETWSFNMIGLPYETKLNMYETLRLNIKIKPKIVQVSTFFPFHGTGLGNISYEKGWVMEEKKDNVESYFEESIMNYPQLSNKEINHFYKNFLLLYLLHTHKYTKLADQIGRRMFRKLPSGLQRVLINQAVA